VNFDGLDSSLAHRNQFAASGCLEQWFAVGGHCGSRAVPKYPSICVSLVEWATREIRCAYVTSRNQVMAQVSVRGSPMRCLPTGAREPRVGVDAVGIKVFSKLPNGALSRCLVATKSRGSHMPLIFYCFCYRALLAGQHIWPQLAASLLVI
jgi:hypothetical protein